MTEKNEEIRIAFAMWELMAQLETLLWDRYFDEFSKMIIELDEERGIDTSSYPF